MATVSLQSAFDAARRALDAGTADRAVAVARYILAHYPRNIEAQRLLGEALLNAGDAEAAALAFGQVLDADPESVAAYYGRGLAFAARDDRMAAIRSFERALEIQPNLAELRTQLIRMYGEAPGASPQLRLSRAGLARLYTRGGMYGQAVDEFRAIEAEADRPDVEAALAEALWRDGQEDEAAAYCRETLDRRPELLKPRLLLGYLLYAGGQPEGEELWRAGAQQDPSLTVARHLFDILPPIRLEDPQLPVFDVDELVAHGYVANQVGAAQGEAVAAQQPAGLALTALPDRPVSDGAAEPVAPDGADGSFEAEAWQAAAAEIDPQSVAPAGSPRDMLSDDALLASLLGIDQQDEPSTAPAGAATQAAPLAPDDTAVDAVPALDQDMLDDIPARAFGQDWPGGDSASELNAGEIEPFALDELAYEDTGASLAPVAEQDAPPVASAGVPDRLDPAFELGEESRSAEADAAPFDEWPAAGTALDLGMGSTEPGPEPGATRDLFSLDDLADDAASWEQAPNAAPADEEQMPFSLADLGIDTAQLGEPGSATGTEDFSLTAPHEAAQPEWDPYTPELTASPADVGQKSDPASSTQAAPAASAGRQAEAGSFSLADLGLTDDEIAALDLNEMEPAQEPSAPSEPPEAPAASAGRPAQNGLRGVFEQLDADPDNASLRLAVARLTSQNGDPGQALEQYRQLVRGGKLLDDIAGDLEDLVSEGGDPQLLRRLHRLLGDTYMKQNRVQEALDQYSWTSEKQ